MKTYVEQTRCRAAMLVVSKVSVEESISVSMVMVVGKAI